MTQQRTDTWSYIETHDGLEGRWWYEHDEQWTPECYLDEVARFYMVVCLDDMDEQQHWSQFSSVQVNR